MEKKSLLICDYAGWCTVDMLLYIKYPDTQRWRIIINFNIIIGQLLRQCGSLHVHTFWTCFLVWQEVAENVRKYQFTISKIYLNYQ